MSLLRHAKTIFFIAAGMNIVGALGAIASVSTHFQMFYALPAPADAAALFYHYNFWAVALLMGASFIVVAREPERRKGLIAIGAAGKITAALSWLVMFAAGKAEALVLAGVVYDLAFGAIFLLLLVEMRRTDAAKVA
jgi:hypothetical protein